MTDICERRLIHRLESDTSHGLAAFVADHRAADGSVCLTLRLPVTTFTAWSMAFERHGVADFHALRSIGDPFPTYSVTWSSQHAGPFPVFAGALAVERLARRDRCGLVLSGHYVPPLGPLGALFDAVVGQRVAHASARDLLAAIAAYIAGRPEPPGRHALGAVAIDSASR